MKNAIERVLNFMEDRSMDDLSETAIEYYGIVKCIEIVGEAAYKLTPLFKDAHPDTPWNVIEKMRHVLVHDYYQVEKNEVKYVVEDDLRPLYEQITRYLSVTNWEEWEKQ
ncbi:MAG: DUF86 domain-containing protein [Bacteroidaceae bacterium]|nr:DUF86 domain-containing protein [Bacteroidaceae bacterium]